MQHCFKLENLNQRSRPCSGRENWALGPVKVSGKLRNNAVFCRSYLHSSMAKEQNYCPGFTPGHKAGAEEIQALERIPLLSMETKSGAQLGAPTGHVLQHWVTPCLQEWGAPPQSHHLGTETGINNWGHISAHHMEGKPQPTENTKALILPTAAPHMSWSREKSKLGTQRKDGKRGQWRIIWFHWIS